MKLLPTPCETYELFPPRMISGTYVGGGPRSALKRHPPSTMRSTMEQPQQLGLPQLQSTWWSCPQTSQCTKEGLSGTMVHGALRQCFSSAAPISERGCPIQPS